MVAECDRYRIRVKAWREEHERVTLRGNGFFVEKVWIPKSKLNRPQQG